MRRQHPRHIRVLPAVCALACLAACRSEAARESGSVLRVVPPADLEILDPTWTTGYLTRDHGYMVYDTLYGVDAQGNIQRQMVGSEIVSPDRKTWTFTLREGLEFHDGQPVTSNDVIASIRRWAVRDTMGQRLLAAGRLDAVDQTTFRLTLKTPYSLVLESFAKPDAYVLFIMPARLATSTTPIQDPIGSGPFIFNKAEWRPGEKVVYVRNPRYRPRPETASGTAGGKVVHVDRVEWVVIKDPHTQVSALQAGDVDVIAEAPASSYATLKKNSDVRLFAINPSGYQYYLRFNHLEPPFDKAEVRRAAMMAMNQTTFLQTQVGTPELYNTCFSVYACNSSYASQAGMAFLAKPEPAAAKAQLAASGYRGERVIVLQPTDLDVISRLAVVACDLLRAAGFVVDLQAMDMSTLQARRAQQHGWHMFATYGAWWARTAPVSENALSAAGYPNAWFGWPSDPELESLRDDFARAETENQRAVLAERIQVRAMEVGTHVPLGEFRVMTATRTNVTGFVTGYNFTAYWNVQKR